MLKKSIFTIFVLIIALFFCLKLKSFVKNHTNNKPIDDAVVCTADAMMCPDGSYVGRSGPLCEFKCPEIKSLATTTVSLQINDTFQFNTISLKPVVVTEESRCPSDVRCIQAGRLKLNVEVASSTVEFEIGKTQKIGDYSITLDDAKPYPISKHKIEDSEYTFVFTINTR